MNNMNPIFSLKNFRSFGEAGADFELAPITVLIGRNSAGKSSLVKALMLLSDQSTGGKAKKGFSDVDRFQPSTVLNTSSGELKLGGFNNVINAQKKDGDLSISYRTWSNYLQEEVVCRRIFRKEKNVLNEGVLLMFTIEKIDGSIIYKLSPNNYREKIYFDGGFQEYVIEHLEPEEYFEIIEKNYQSFALVCSYVSLCKRIEAQLKLLEKKGVDKNKLKDLIAEQERMKMQLGVISPDNYNDEIIQRWNKRWDILFKERNELERLYLQQRTKEEQETDDKTLFFTLIINEILAPWFIKSLDYIDSSTNEIRRIYNAENQDKFSKLLNSLIRSQASTTYKSGPFANKWLKQFKIGNSVEIVGTDEGLGVKVYLEENDGTKMLLADEGYGITQIISILLQIELAIKMHMRYDEKDDKLYNLPHVICIEEPEVHLHPQYQSWLAEMFVEAYQNHGTHFIIETHSEYLIRNLQVMVADKENVLTPNDVSLNYVEKDENGVSTNRKIDILEDGRLSKPFGTGFFDESKNLVMKMLKF